MASNFELTVIRHANAVKAAAEGHNADMDRPLSPHGIEQARNRARLLGTLYGPRKFQIVAASPAERTLLTAEIVTGVPRHEIRAMRAFCFEPAIASEDWAAFDAAFNRHGYAPLRTFLEDDAARTAVLNIGWNMAANVAALSEEIDDGAKIAIFTHAVMGVSMTHGLLAADTGLASKHRGISMPEAGGYVARFEGGVIVAVDELPALETQAA